MAAIECLSVHHHSADCISFPLESLAHCGILENGGLLLCTLEGVNSVANLVTAFEESQ